MFGEDEVYVAAWACIEAGCRIRCEVYHDTAEFNFGGTDVPYQMAFSPGALEKMARVIPRALAEQRRLAASRTGRVEFTDADTSTDAEPAPSEEGGEIISRF